jgi:hypothetical protein
MDRPDLVVASLPGKGFFYTSEKASQGLRDARTLRDLEEAVRIIHLINSLWPGSPCAYLFETVDATNHPQEDVRDEFNNDVKRILGPGVSFDPLAVSSDAYRARCLWTNRAPAPLISEMIQEAGSYAFQTDDLSMVHPGTLSLWDDPSALGTERERTFFGISLNCNFGTDKAARHGGYRAAQPPAPTVPVGTCRHHELPVGTCRHRRRYQHCRHETDRRQPIGTKLSAGYRRRTQVGSPVGSLAAVDRSLKLYLNIIPTRPFECLPAVGRHHAPYHKVYRSGLAAVGRYHAAYHKVYQTCLLRHQHASF